MFFELGNEEIKEQEMTYILASYIIGAGSLTIPRILANITNFFDGWICLVLGGMIAGTFTWVSVKLASRFPNQPFFMYVSSICSKPVAIVITICFVVYFIGILSYETRFVSIISKQYLLPRTPEEIISLLFLFVLVYAVSGTRIGVLRLNLLFLPIILFLALIVLGINIPIFKLKNLSPFFTTSWDRYLKGTKESIFFLSGSEIILFYLSFVKHSKKVGKFAMIGVSIPLGLYLFVYMMAVGVFTAKTNTMLVYPTIELAKEAEVPGGFFGRLESLFFTIWLMTIFNTASLLFDMAIICLNSLFQKVKKIKLIIILTPIIFLFAMYQKTLLEVSLLGKYLSYFTWVLGILLPSILLLLAKVRGIEGNG
ncbi:endospore germination permease [Bacillus xiapuensis]|uniref:Endospore germination permease n=1 Tax=Bacillus xiapuensis TaxID=2014075 RepID=A0ABU6NCB1_9BACI|nr:endospore germination permease [Bacillus xiapuensis]